MSSEYSQEYARISFDRVVPEEELRTMLADLSIKLLDRQLSKSDHFSQLEDITDEIENDVITRAEASEQITDISQNYLREIDYANDCTSLLVLSEYQSESYDTDIAIEIAKHLFAKSSKSHFIWRTASFDNYGAYSHQWIGFWEDHKVEMIDADEYFTKQFAIPAAA